MNGALIKKYQDGGYRISSTIDPLGLWKPPGNRKDFDPQNIDSLKPEKYMAKKGCATVDDLVKYLEKTYAGKATVEFSHIVDEKERIWLHKKFEKAMGSEVSNE